MVYAKSHAPIDHQKLGAALERMQEEFTGPTYNRETGEYDEPITLDMF